MVFLHAAALGMQEAGDTLRERSRAKQKDEERGDGKERMIEIKHGQGREYNDKKTREQALRWIGGIENRERDRE